MQHVKAAAAAVAREQDLIFLLLLLLNRSSLFPVADSDFLQHGIQIGPIVCMVIPAAACLLARLLIVDQFYARIVVVVCTDKIAARSGVYTYVCIIEVGARISCYL